MIDLHDAGISADGPFRVGVERRHDGPPSVAVDDDGLTPGRSFVLTPGGGWQDAGAVGASGDWVIRATLAGSGAVAVPVLPAWGHVLLVLLLGAAATRFTRSPR